MAMKHIIDMYCHLQHNHAIMFDMEVRLRTREVNGDGFVL